MEALHSAVLARNNLRAANEALEEAFSKLKELVMNAFPRRIFFDMDGVLAERIDVSVEDYNEPGFFLHRSPQLSMLRAARILNQDPNYEVFVLTKVPSLMAIGEKEDWLSRYLLGISSKNWLIIPEDMEKKDAVPGGIRSGDILVDDYGRNGDLWGLSGIYVKVSKDSSDRIYEESKHKHVISPDMSEKEIVELLKSI